MIIQETNSINNNKRRYADNFQLAEIFFSSNVSIHARLCVTQSTIVASTCSYIKVPFFIVSFFLAFLLLWSLVALLFLAMWYYKPAYHKKKINKSVPFLKNILNVIYQLSHGTMMLKYNYLIFNKPNVYLKHNSIFYFWREHEKLFIYIHHLFGGKNAIDGLLSLINLHCNCLSFYTMISVGTYLQLSNRIKVWNIILYRFLLIDFTERSFGLPFFL